MKLSGAIFQGYQDGDRVMLIGEAGYVLKRDAVHGSLLERIGATAFWKLRCFSGFAPDPRAVDLATCEAPGVLSQPGRCVEDAGCRGALALARGAAAVGTDCAQLLLEGASCRATCAGGSVPKGVFTCSRGEMVGDAVCVEEGEGIQVAQVRRIVGTMALVLNATPRADELSEGFAAGLDIPVSLIKNVEFAPAAGNRQLKGGRRLQEDRFQVKYEVGLADAHSNHSMVLMANALSQTNSSVQQRFQQQLLTGAGLDAGRIEPVIAARIVNKLVLKEDNGTVMPLPDYPQPEQAESEPTGLDVALIISIAVGGFCALVLILCIAQYCVLMQRKANA